MNEDPVNIDDLWAVTFVPTGSTRLARVYNQGGVGGFAVYGRERAEQRANGWSHRGGTTYFVVPATLLFESVVTTVVSLKSREVAA